MRSSRPSLSVAFGLATLFATLAVPCPSFAELPSIDVRTFRPSTDPRAQLVLEPVNAPAAWAFNAGAWASYAYRPVTLRGESAAFLYRPVRHHLGLDLTAGLGLGARASVGILLPMALYQVGSDPLPKEIATTLATPTTAIGDVTISGKGTLLANEQGGLGVAALGALTLPTGNRASYLGEGAATASARFVVDYDLLIAGVQASLGFKLRTSERTWPDPTLGGTTFGGEVPWTFGVRFRPGILKKIVAVDTDNRQSWEIGARGALPAGPVGPFGSGEPGSARLSPLLLAISDRIELGHYRDSFLLVGLDLGLVEAVGVPTVRGILAVGWAPREHDLDHDGVPDDLDQCPEITEDRDGFEDSDGCPDIDNDEDGITDEEDACPRVAGVASGEPSKNGCPAIAAAKPPRVVEHEDCEAKGGCPDSDNDGDGVANASDACPQVAGEPSTDPSRHGCPNADRDGDTYENASDACPDAAEVFNGLADEDGCPDEGGKSLATIDVKNPRLPVSLTSPITFTGPPEDPVVSKASLFTLRALALELNRHREWTLAVGARPAAGKPEVEGARALGRSFAIVRELSAFTHRDGGAETVAWDAVKAQPGSSGGVGWLVLVAPVEPLRQSGPGGR